MPLTDMMRSPMLRAPQRSAGPPWSRLATITVGRMEPQPDSTTATPTISLGALEMDTWTQTVVTVLAGPQLTGLDVVGMEELLVGHTEGLANRLSDHLGLHAGETQ